MSNQPQARATQVQAFGKTRSGGVFTRITAAGLIFAGTVAATVAVLTAVAPVANDQVRTALEGMDRLGLDKGPLAFFGVMFVGIGLGLARLSKLGGGARDSANAAAYSAQNSTDLEEIGAILSVLQGEFGVLRQELAAAHREIQEARAEGNSKTTGDAANDPIFRLAASLDQLGARVDKRIDSSRKEMIEAVSEMSETIQEVTKEQTEAAREQRSEFEGLRMDMADLHAEISRVGDDDPAGQPSAAPLPRELSGAPASLSLGASSQDAAPAAPLPSSSSSDAPEASELFEFATPPPIISSGEGLELLDHMEDNTAHDSGATPPLFPDLDKGGF